MGARALLAAVLVACASCETLPALKLRVIRGGATPASRAGGHIAQQGAASILVAQQPAAATPPRDLRVPARRVGKRGDTPVARSERRRAVRIAVNLFLWWTLNVVFNLGNKQCLDSWPHPWALATLHLAVGSACMLPLYFPLPRLYGDAGVRWAPVRRVPALTRQQLLALFPVTALLCIGHVASTLAPAYGTVAFANIIKTAEPLFTCAISYVLFRRVFPRFAYAVVVAVAVAVGASPQPSTWHNCRVHVSQVRRSADGCVRRRALLHSRPQLLELHAHRRPHLQRRLN